MSTESEYMRTDLANSEMAEATNEFSLVEGVSGHLHAAHSLHLPVHGEQFVLGDLHLKVGGVAEVGAERIVMKLHCDGFRQIGRLVAQLSGVGGLLNAPNMSTERCRPNLSTWWL